MTLDLSKIKSDAEKIAANSDLLLMALPVKDVLGMLSELEKFDDGMRALAFQLSAGGYNAETLTADQLVCKVSDGLKAFTDSTGALVDSLRKDAERYRSIRDNELDIGIARFHSNAEDLFLNGTEADECVDAAIAKERT